MCALRRILEAQTAVSKVTKVTLKTGKLAGMVLVLGCLASLASGQRSEPAKTPGPAESLYLKLRTVGLDKTRVYKIREASLERASLAFFTGAAILEETFSSAYLRFNDDVYSELQPSLRTADDPEAFAAEWNMTAHNLAEEDALRLLLTFSDSLPSSDKTASLNGNDHFLHALVQGNKLGTFDARYDSLMPEQISAGQHKKVEGQEYYDVWASFSAAGRG